MFVFLDESGKPEVYSSKGTNLVDAGTATKHLVLAAVKTTDHLELQKQITEFKSKLLRDTQFGKYFSAAYALDAFHANNDHREIREAFYTFIAGLKNVEIHVIVAEKLRCSETLKENPTKFYGTMAGLLLHGICHQDTQAEIIFSRQDNGKKMKQELELEVDRIREFNWNRHKKPPKNIVLKYQHNPHYSHGGLQVADYIAYAMFQYYEKGDPGYLGLVQKRIRHVFHYNDKKHFTRSRPLELS